MHLAPEYETNEIPEHFRDLSFAYLEASERLCQEIATGSWAPSFHRGQVTLWLAFHATELFLKACIRSASPNQLKNLHSLGELLLVFSSCFPTLKFEPPFGPEPMPADPVLMEMAVKSDATLHQQLRYPVDTSGSPWPGVRAFTPELFLSELERLRGDFERISLVVFAK